MDSKENTQPNLPRAVAALAKFIDKFCRAEEQAWQEEKAWHEAQARATAGDEDCKLTTDHAASSYGIPVLLVNGVAYGVNDREPSGELARDRVKLSAFASAEGAEERTHRAAVRLFLGLPEPEPLPRVCVVCGFVLDPIETLAPLCPHLAAQQDRNMRTEVDWCAAHPRD